MDILENRGKGGGEVGFPSGDKNLNLDGYLAVKTGGEEVVDCGACHESR